MKVPMVRELLFVGEVSCFVQVTTDTIVLVAAKYNVSAMPTFIFIKNGEILDRLMGANMERLQELLEEHK
jgi:thioredoxin 1